MCVHLLSLNKSENLLQETFINDWVVKVLDWNEAKDELSCRDFCAKNEPRAPSPSQAAESPEQTQGGQATNSNRVFSPLVLSSCCLPTPCLQAFGPSTGEKWVALSPDKASAS